MRRGKEREGGVRERENRIAAPWSFSANTPTARRKEVRDFLSGSTFRARRNAPRQEEKGKMPTTTPESLSRSRVIAA